MRLIPLTQGQFAMVDDADYESLIQAGSWYADKKGNTFYAARGVVVNGEHTIQYMRRFLMGDSDGKSDIDHEDRDGRNNQRLNMRPCTHQENLMNRRKRKNRSSKYIGVSWHKRDEKW